MNRIELIIKLKKLGVIRDSKTPNGNSRIYTKPLTDNIDLVQQITTLTSFLTFSGTIRERIKCLLLGITENPKCIVCGVDLKMADKLVFREYCSSTCVSRSVKTRAKYKSTCQTRYGSDNYLASDEGMAKSKKTLMDRYGVENSMHLDATKDKSKQTLIAHYGSLDVAYKTQQDLREQSMMRQYGAAHPMHIEEFKNKMKSTNKDRYGVECVFANNDVQGKIQQSMVTTHGAAHPMQVPSIKIKQEQTMLQRHGYTNQYDNEEIRNKGKHTRLERYGVVSVFSLAEFKDKARQTMISRYGVEFPGTLQSSPEILDKLNDYDFLIEQHHNQKKTPTKIAEELGCSHSTVGIYIRKHGIEFKQYQQSQAERDILALCASLTSYDIISGDRNIIKPLELDIYIPELKIALEYDGLYYHSDLSGKDRNYHLNKTKLCTEQEIRLIHIFENEWISKPEIVTSRIQNLFGKSKRLYARKCSIVEITPKQKIIFNKANHIQGDCASSINYGLIHDGVLVAVMTFGKARYNKKYEYELLRYSNLLGHTVVGGASRLFTYFMKTIQPSSIITYSDKRWNTGNLYTQLGFEYSHTSAPNYYYMYNRNDMLMSRTKFQKHKLHKVLESFDSSKTEWHNMVEHGFDRIWDCGNDVFIVNKG